MLFLFQQNKLGGDATVADINFQLVCVCVCVCVCVRVCVFSPILYPHPNFSLQIVSPCVWI